MPTAAARSARRSPWDPVDSRPRAAPRGMTHDPEPRVDARRPLRRPPGPGAILTPSRTPRRRRSRQPRSPRRHTAASHSTGSRRSVQEAGNRSVAGNAITRSAGRTPTAVAPRERGRAGTVHARDCSRQRGRGARAPERPEPVGDHQRRTTLRGVGERGGVRGARKGTRTLDNVTTRTDSTRSTPVPRPPANAIIAIACPATTPAGTRGARRDAGRRRFPCGRRRYLASAEPGALIRGKRSAAMRATCEGVRPTATPAASSASAFAAAVPDDRHDRHRHGPSACRAAPRNPRCRRPPACHLFPDVLRGPLLVVPADLAGQILVGVGVRLEQGSDSMNPMPCTGSPPMPMQVD